MAIAKELIKNFKNNSLEPVLLQRTDSTRLSRAKYLVTHFIDFSVYKRSFARCKLIVIYCYKMHQVL